MPEIHPSSIVAPTATIGVGTRVWHFCHIMDGAELGRDCVVGQNCFIGSRVRIGSRVKLQNNVSVYEGVTLEDEVFCGPSMVFTNVRAPRAFVDRSSKFLRTLVRRGASIGANATILPGVTLGRYCFVSAGATVTRDVPDYALVVGVPARQTGWVSRVGAPLAVRNGTAKCPETAELYHLIGGELAPVVDA